jgi:hypothetical protein
MQKREISFQRTFGIDETLGNYRNYRAFLIHFGIKFVREINDSTEINCGDKRE